MRAQNAIQRMDALVEICQAAHQAILPYWKTDLAVETKADDSPVTLADKAANDVIVSALHKLNLDIPIISEEGEQPQQPQDGLFWLIDPLDGTQSFIRGSNEFTVNIALVENRQPVLGIIGVPAQNMIYKAVKSQPAYKRIGQQEWKIIQTSKRPKDGLRVVSSRSLRSPKLVHWLNEHGVKIKERIGAASALKFGLIAEGVADIYPRIGPTMEWDTAAGHCIVESAGGIMTDLHGKPFLYGKDGYLNEGFLVRGVA